MTKRSELCAHFLAHSDWAKAERTPLSGDASTRSYERLFLPGKTALLMNAPQDSETPICPKDATPQERRKLGYNAEARLAGSDMDSFITIANILKEAGLSAPGIYDADVENGFAIIEDLGHNIYARTIEQGADELELYRKAVDALIHIARENVRPTGARALMQYDSIAMQAETQLLLQWYWPYRCGQNIDKDLQAEYDIIWQNLFAQLSHPDVMVLRDYHAENLLWLPERNNVAQCGLIDFQDGLIGHKAYDLVSLLEDARRDVSPTVVAPLKQYYMSGLEFDKAQQENFERDYAILGAQRNAKILGIFVRLAHRDGKPHYLDLLPRVERHFRQNLKHPVLQALQQFFVQHISDIIS